LEEFFLSKQTGKATFSTNLSIENEIGIWIICAFAAMAIGDEIFKNYLSVNGSCSLLKTIYFITP
jgi:hypothetical protein